MRLAFLLLLLINIALWPFASGMLVLGNDGAEPLRLTSQIDPERIRIVPVGGGAAAPVVAIAPVVASEPASDAEVTPAAVCRVLAGFTREQVGRIDVTDYLTYVAVERNIADEVVRRLDGGRVKGRDVKVKRLGSD